MASRQEQEEREKASVLSLIKAVLDIKGVSTLNLNLQAFVHLLKTVLKPETWQNLLQVIVRKLSWAPRGGGRQVQPGSAGAPGGLMILKTNVQSRLYLDGLSLAQS